MNTWNSPKRVRFCITLCVVAMIYSTSALAQKAARNRIVEAYPSKLFDALESYREQIRSAAAANSGVAPYYLIVPRLQRWTPGQTVRVAFNGGNEALYGKIRAVALTWLQKSGANLELKFDDGAGRTLRWSSTDKNYAAEIRISFLSGPELGGYWSAVGSNSINAAIGYPPNEPSMNFQGFDTVLPDAWEAVVLHEFGHALGFEHEHQMPVGGCDFRYLDDPGYQLTKDSLGWYTEDALHRRPGAYTYFGGYSNYWEASKVDRNLRPLTTSSAFLMSGFDNASIMKYWFPDIIFCGWNKKPLLL